MPKANKPSKTFRKQARHRTEDDPVVTFHQPMKRGPAQPLEPRTEMQRIYMDAVASKRVVFAFGPAGTGKTYIPVAMAAEALAGKRTSKVIITRPAVEAGETMGFLPGELEEKYEPYLQPVRQVLTDRLGKSPLEYYLKTKDIEPVPLGFMRGMTFEDCWVILDEAQNVTPKQMKMFLTRIGPGCKVIICGDTDQVDIEGPSGLADAIERMAWIDEFAQIEFTLDDVVRDPLVMKVLRSYARR